MGKKHASQYANFGWLRYYLYLTAANVKILKKKENYLVLKFKVVKANKFIYCFYTKNKKHLLIIYITFYSIVV